jgi:hypothetical protein
MNLRSDHRRIQYLPSQDKQYKPQAEFDFHERGDWTAQDYKDTSSTFLTCSLFNDAFNI